MLRTRVCFVQANIARIEQLIEAVKEHKRDISESVKFLRKTAEDLQKCNDDLQNLLKGIREYAKYSPDEQLITDIGTALTYVNNTDRIVDGVSRRATVIEKSESVLLRISQQGGAGSAIKQGVQAEVEKTKKRLEAVLEKLDASKDREAWEEFKKVRLKSRNLFSEYVDLLGGLALRDIGFDEGACQLADELFRSYTLGERNELLAIPSRSKAMDRSWAPIIRLTFPEWTIWSLPLSAREFWFAVARDAFRAQKKLADVDLRQPAMQECIADAFGTLALGPAYAYAAVLLHLDPFSAFKSQPPNAPDDMRAEAIFTALDEMGPKDSPHDFKGIREKLQAQWKDAVQNTQPIGKEDANGKAKVRSAVIQLASSMRSKVDSGISLNSWNTFQTWADLLRDGNESKIPISGAELRWVLNAAWLARTNSSQASLEEITKRTKTLWNRVLENIQSGSANRGPRPPQQRIQSA